MVGCCSYGQVQVMQTVIHLVVMVAQAILEVITHLIVYARAIAVKISARWRCIPVLPDTSGNWKRGA